MVYGASPSIECYIITIIVEVAEQAFGIVCMDLPERVSIGKDHEEFKVTFHYEHLDDFKEVDNKYGRSSCSIQMSNYSVLS